MPRASLTDRQRRQGRALGQLLQRGRGEVSAARVAQQAGISVDALRKLERGDVPTPGFFLIADLALVIGLRLDDLAQSVATSEVAAS